jgi:Sec-independent protein translocase protein TatA
MAYYRYSWKAAAIFIAALVIICAIVYLIWGPTGLQSLVNWLGTRPKYH